MIFVLGKGFLEIDENTDIKYTLYPTTHENVLKFNDVYDVESWVLNNDFQQKYIVVQEAEAEEGRW